MFEQLGYFKEYYINNKFIGKAKCDKDREKFGYYGQIKEVIKEQILLDNKKVIKPGSKVTTFLYPINGKIIKTK